MCYNIMQYKKRGRIMKKILGLFLLIIFCFLIGCDQQIEKRYELDLSSIEETMELDDFDIFCIDFLYIL